ncbi:hypothetical protein NKI77_10145 [Mesorhizobium opportunistum]|uniref:Transcriptional regulator n=1 Tax=Mesorhizobium opportunistum TaxID=593909 RepID=A0ABV1YPS2_9HYPH
MNHTMSSRPPKPADTPASPRFKDKGAKIPRKPNLGQLHKSHPTDEDYEALWKELDTGKPRSVALVGAAYLQEALRFSLDARFIKMTRKELDDRIFSPSGPLNSFSQAIELGYALGLYGSVICEDMHIIRVVRNLFAHTMKNVSFDTPDIGKEISHLSYFRMRKGKFEEPTDGRMEYTVGELIDKWNIWTNQQRYVFSCKEIAYAITAAVDHSKSPGPAALP